jgi:hypothetical protein
LTGGNTIALTGTGFTGATRVWFTTLVAGSSLRPTPPVSRWTPIRRSPLLSPPPPAGVASTLRSTWPLRTVTATTASPHLRVEPPPDRDTHHPEHGGESRRGTGHDHRDGIHRR